MLQKRIELTVIGFTSLFFSLLFSPELTFMYPNQWTALNWCYHAAFVYCFKHFVETLQFPWQSVVLKLCLKRNRILVLLVAKKWLTKATVKVKATSNLRTNGIIRPAGSETHYQSIQILWVFFNPQSLRWQQHSGLWPKRFHIFLHEELKTS